MKDRRENERTPLVKVSDDQNGPNGIPTEWHFDADVKKYKRYQGDIFLSSIRGRNLPDPYEMAKSRKATIIELVKHVSAEKIAELAGKALAKGKDPEKEILKMLEPKAAPAQALYDMWSHWQGVKDA